jgi:hypothetical protein
MFLKMAALRFNRFGDFNKLILCQSLVAGINEGKLQFFFFILPFKSLCCSVFFIMAVRTVQGTSTFPFWIIAKIYDIAR